MHLKIQTNSQMVVYTSISKEETKFYINKHD
jgi:hypothetical protein